VEIDDGVCPVVLDCGTGARALGRDLVLRHVKEVVVLLSHYHMDHLYGFPYFGPIFTPNCRVTVAAPGVSAVDVKNRLGRYMNGRYHPIRIDDVAEEIELVGMRPGGRATLGKATVTAASLSHPGGCLGYRVEFDGRSVAYLTDTGPLSPPHQGLSAGLPASGAEKRVLELVKGVDLLVMDTMFSFEEYLTKMTWGHCHPGYAIRLAEAAGAKRLGLFHHAPDASDEALDQLAVQWCDHPTIDVHMAQEGKVVDLEG